MKRVENGHNKLMKNDLEEGFVERTDEQEKAMASAMDALVSATVLPDYADGAKAVYDSDDDDDSGIELSEIKAIDDKEIDRTSGDAPPTP